MWFRARQRAESPGSATSLGCIRLNPVTGALLALLLVGVVPARAQQVDPDFPITDGFVNAIAVSGSTVYIGGDFTHVGPQTGNLVPIDATGGSALPGWPKVNGSVRAVAPDGSGGWYVGGYFTRVGNMPRSNLAHIRADLTLDPWDPGTDGFVFALAVIGSTVYVGGGFTQAGGEARNNLAAIDATTGLATSWNPSPNSTVYALAPGGSTVYAGGFFTDLGGTTRTYLAEIDATSGSPTSWDAQVNSWYDGVYSLAFDGTTVYLCGSFYEAGGQPRGGIAAVDAISGLATSFDPAPDNRVMALAVSGSTVYAGGQFTFIGGLPRSQIAALDAGTGLATGWDPNTISSYGVVNALAVSGSTVYAGGYFTGMGGQPRVNLAAIDAMSGLATSWDPSPFGGVSVIAVDGTTVLVGGDVSSVGGQARNRIAAIDATTGALTSWNPDADAPVSALAVSGGIVYVGGMFTSIGGQPRACLAELDVATGLATSWDPNPSGGFPTWVQALAVDGATVFAGGDFTTIGGQSRTGIAAISAATGLATSWNANAGTYSIIRDLTLSGATLYAAGDFPSMGGQPRAGLAALDAGTGMVTSWNPTGGGNIWALAVDGSTVYVGGFFFGIGGQSRNCIAALDATTGLATGWNPGTSFGSVSALAVSGSIVYAGGFFTEMGGQFRSKIAAIDAASGLVTSWDPNANDQVNVLTLGPTTVYAGGFFTGMGDAPARGIAAISADETAVPVVLASLEAEPTDAGVQLRWDIQGAGSPERLTILRQNGLQPEVAVVSFASGQTTAVGSWLDTGVFAGGRLHYRLVGQIQGVQISSPVVDVEVTPSVVMQSRLVGAAPNPFNPTTRLEYVLARPGRVRLGIYDAAGRLTRDLDLGARPAGRGSVEWDGRDSDGRSVSSGVYLVRMRSESGNDRIHVALVK